MVLIDLILVLAIRLTVTLVRLVIIASKAKDFHVHVHPDFTVRAGSKKNDLFIRCLSFGKGQADHRTRDTPSTPLLIRLNAPFIPTMMLVMVLPLMIASIAHQDTSAMKLESVH